MTRATWRACRHRLGPSLLLPGLLLLAAVMPVVSPLSPHSSQSPPPRAHSIAQQTSSDGRSDHRASDINSLSPQQRKHFLDALESSLMNTFGIEKRRHKTAESKDKAVYVPKRMQLLYEQLNGLEEGTLRHELAGRRARHGRHRSPPGNTVRSFYYKHTGNLTDGEHISFDISSFPDHETLHEAHLHLLHKPTEEALQVSSNQTKYHSVDILQILHSRGSRVTLDAYPTVRLVDTKTMSHMSDGWHTFDISSVVHQWKTTPHSNHGLIVRVRTPLGERSPHDHHVRVRRAAGVATRQWHEQQPYMVTYGDDGKQPTTDKHKDRRTRRSRKRNRKSKKRRKKKNICKKHKLYVDFGDVGWNDWIVAPAGYDAFYCHGDCPFYLPDNLNATNHAVVQSLVHSVNPQAVPKPCCVPTELSSMSMLYMNYDNNVVLKTYRDMVVEHCGCR